MSFYGKYYYQDGLVLPVGKEIEEVSGEASFYEVIRTFSGTPLFFEDHIARLKEGIATRYPVPAQLEDYIRSGIKALCESEHFNEINIRVLVTFRGNDFSVQICYLHSSYPSEKDFIEGVNLILYNAERKDPGVKLLNTSMRSSVNEELKRRNAFEALLVNREGYITEGSRSNVFFITDDAVVFTAPDEMVLRGITRKYVTHLCKQEGIRLVYEPVMVSQLKRYSTVFITGTSPMVLPVRRIDRKVFNPVNKVVSILRELYITVAEESIRKYLG